MDFESTAFFKTKPIIAACSQNDIEKAAESRAGMIILMNSSVSWLAKPALQNIMLLKPVFLHLDFIKGLSEEKETILFLKEFIRPTGIISTKSAVIRTARKEGIPAIQRVFLIDTASFDYAVEKIQANDPTALEIMPGIAPEAIRRIKEKIHIPVIAAGLIKTKDDIHNAFAAGANAVSMSARELWNLEAR